jgi:hypothetical protein
MLIVNNLVFIFSQGSECAYIFPVTSEEKLFSVKFVASLVVYLPHPAQRAIFITNIETQNR